MPLIYSAVARGPVILSEYAAFAGNFSTVAKDYLSKTSNVGRFAHTVDHHDFTFLVDDGFCYIAVADEATGRIIPNAFLDRVKDEFTAKYREKAAGVKELGLSSFGKRLKEIMEHVTQYPEEYSKVASAQKKVDEVKNIMSENIEKVLSRGEKLDTLVDKTDNLMSEADRFVKSGRQLRRNMWWANCKMKLVIAFVAVMVAVIIFLLVCFGGRTCKLPHRSSTSATASPAPDAAAPVTGQRRLLGAATDLLFQAAAMQAL